MMIFFAMYYTNSLSWILTVQRQLKQHSTGRHVALLRHMTPNQPVNPLTPEWCVLSLEAGRFVHYIDQLIKGKGHGLNKLAWKFKWQ